MKVLVPLKRVSDPDNANKIKIAASNAAVDTTGLEWKIQSPPITHNFAVMPVVTEEADDYQHAPMPQREVK